MNPAFEYNEDELKAPEWLNEKFLQHIIDNIDDFEKGLKIFTFTIQPASLKGDHYASIMFRATIECTRETFAETCKTLQVIIKTRPPLDTPKGRNLSETQIFKNEWKMYTQVIPLLEAEWRCHGENLQFAGRLLYATLHPQPVIVLEDLCLAGYDILRGRPFNLAEVEACLCKLAKWHAVSYKLTANSNITNAHAVNANQKGRDNATVTKEQHVAIVSDYRDGNGDDKRNDNLCMAKIVTSEACDLTQMQFGFFKQKSMMDTAYFRKGVHHMIEALEETASLGNDDNDNSFKEYIKKLWLLEPHIITACNDMNDAFVKGISGPIYVLNHGDIHSGNIMIHKAAERENINSSSYKELQDSDILFIDFQESFFGPSVFDLQFAYINFYTMELRDEKRDYLQRYYFNNFLSSLQKLSFQGFYPTYEQFEDDCKRWRCWELFNIGVFLPFTTFCRDTDVDFNRVFDDENYRKSFYRNPLYLEYLRKLLPTYLKNGYLENFEKY